MTSGSASALTDTLTAVQRLLDAWSQRGVVIGGVAASLLGQPRYTADVDVLALVAMEEISAFLVAAAQVGLVGRIPDVEAFARRSRVLLLRHAESGVDVDISLGILPFEEQAVLRSTMIQVDTVAVRLVTPEDLVIMKAVAHRPKDLEDIRAVIQRHPNLDRERVRLWVTQFAQALEMPELWDDIVGWLDAKQKRTQKKRR